MELISQTTICALLEQISETTGFVNIYSPLSLGLKTGEYMPISGPAELPQDQRDDDVHGQPEPGEPVLVGLGPVRGHEDDV